jgi:WD40 repeat protein
MSKERTAPLLRNIYSTNAALKVECEWVINNTKEIKWIKFSPDDRFLFVTDSKNVTVYDLTHWGIKCSISHKDNVIGVRFPDNCSFALISDVFGEYSIKRYSYEGILLASSNSIINRNNIAFLGIDAVIENSTISWPVRADSDKPVLNLYDYYINNYVIKGLVVRKITENFRLISLQIRLEIRRLFLLMKDQKSETGQVIVIDIDSKHIVKEFILQEIGNVHQVSKCGGYLATYTEGGELWVYDLNSKERKLILKYDRFGNKKIIPMNRSSFLCTGPPKGNSNGHEQIIYDIYVSASVIIKVVAIAYFNVSDDFKYLMEVGSYSLIIWDINQSEITGKFEGSKKLDIFHATLSAKGNYIAIKKNREVVNIFKREKLPSTGGSDSTNMKFYGYTHIIDNNYLMYECTETERDPWKARSYCKLLKLSGFNETGENKQQYISERGTICGTYSYYGYLRETGYLIVKRDTKLYFYSIETGKEALNIEVLKRFGGLVIIEDIAISINKNRFAVLSSTGLLKIYDTGYLKSKKYTTTIPSIRCIRRIRVAPRSQKITAKFIKFITDNLIFVGFSNGHVKILEIASSKVISQNSIDKVPDSIHIIDNKTILVVSKDYNYNLPPKRLYIWDYVENNIKPLMMVIDGEAVYDFNAYRLSTQTGFLAVAVNGKGVYAINLECIDDIKRVGDLGWIYHPSGIKLFGIFEILPEKQKLLVIDVAPGKINEPYPKKRIRIWDINSWQPSFDEDTFFEEYDDIEIVSAKYIALWSKKDDCLKLYDLNLNLLIIKPILDFYGYSPQARSNGIIKSWGSDKLITIGSDLNIFQIV